MVPAYLQLPPPTHRVCSCVLEDRSGADVGYAHEGTNARRRAQHKTVKAPRVSPSPQVVNDDILREALMVAEHVEESDVPSSSLSSSDPKSSSEGSESARVKKPSRSVHPTSSMEGGRGGTRGSTTKPAPTSSMTTTSRHRQSSHDVRDKRQRPEVSPRRKTPRHPDDSVTLVKWGIGSENVWCLENGTSPVACDASDEERCHGDA